MQKTSKAILTESIERRMKHVMVQLLKQFEERFPALSDDQYGRLFKFDIKNQFNDAMRATRDEIRDYDVEYRPMRFNPDNTLSVTKAFIEGVQHIYFNSIGPGMKIVAGFSPDNCRILEAIRRELGTGIVYSSFDNKTVTFSVNGLENCINAVIPFMDLYKLLSPVQSEYATWRNIVIGVYNGDR